MSCVEFVTTEIADKCTYVRRVTRSLGEALRWFDAGRKVMVKINGRYVGMMKEGKAVDDMDDDVFYDDEPYGTIHYIRSTRFRHIRLPNDSRLYESKRK